MFSNLFNKREKSEEKSLTQNIDFSFLGADMHSHFIPGIDDGAKTIEDSTNLIKAMVDLGYRTIITTPHVMVDYYPNTTQSIQNGLESIKNIIKENNIHIGVKAAAEYYIDEYFIRLLETEPLLTIYQNEVLVECSMLYEPPMLINVLFNMISSGYRPIFAHPERYLFFHNKFDKYSELKDRGCLLQLNTLSVTGYYGKNIKAVAEQLLAAGMYDYLGSDIHSIKHIETIKKMDIGIYQALVSYPFLNSRLCL
jgi:protein-tyrosine phosphatase